MQQAVEQFPPTGSASPSGLWPEQAKLDEISQRILLLLSSGQSLSIREVARVLGISMEEVWRKLTVLDQARLVTALNGRISLGPDGMRLLEKWGIIRPSAAGEPTERQRKPALPIALLGAFPDLIIWGLVPVVIILFSLALIGASWISLQGALPFDERFVQIPIVLFIIALAATVLQRYWQQSFHRIPEYESYVVFRLGNCIGSRGPGPTLLNPIIDQWNTVDLRVSHLEVPHETCITRDNVQIDVDFVLYWRVEQPVWSVTRVQSPQESLNLLATALLRAVIAHFPFNEVLNQRERINESLKEKIDEISTDWGVYVTTVEIREIKPPKDIVDSMHLQAAAEWKRQATVTESEGYKQAAIKHAEGDSQALEMLFKVAKDIDPKTMQLKYLDALAKLGQSSSTKYVFPLEFMQLIRPFVQNVASRASNPADENGSPHTITGEELIELLRTLADAASKQKSRDESDTTETPAPLSPPQTARIIGRDEGQAA